MALGARRRFSSTLPPSGTRFRSSYIYTADVHSCSHLIGEVIKRNLEYAIFANSVKEKKEVEVRRIKYTEPRVGILQALQFRFQTPRPPQLSFWRHLESLRIGPDILWNSKVLENCGMNMVITFNIVRSVKTLHHVFQHVSPRMPTAILTTR